MVRAEGRADHAAGSVQPVGDLAGRGWVPTAFGMPAVALTAPDGLAHAKLDEGGSRAWGWCYSVASAAHLCVARSLSQGIDLIAGGRNKRVHRTAPKSENPYVKLLVKVRRLWRLRRPCRRRMASCRSQRALARTARGQQVDGDAATGAAGEQGKQQAAAAAAANLQRRLVAAQLSPLSATSAISAHTLAWEGWNCNLHTTCMAAQHPAGAGISWASCVPAHDVSKHLVSKLCSHHITSHHVEAATDTAQHHVAVISHTGHQAVPSCAPLTSRRLCRMVGSLTGCLLLPVPASCVFCSPAAVPLPGPPH